MANRQQYSDMTRAQKQIVDAGFDAHNAGKGKTDNPYALGSAQHALWTQGFGYGVQLAACWANRNSRR